MPTDQRRLQFYQSEDNLHPETHDNTMFEITPQSFNDYWFETTRQRNIEEDHPERNDPSHSWPVGRIEPHQLGNCKRQWFYRWLNAPKEEHDPHGIFAIGHFIEEDVVEPWLESLTGPDQYIDNAVHVGTNIDTIPLDDLTDTIQNDDDDDDTATTPPTEAGVDVPINQGIQTDPSENADTVTITIAGSTDPIIKEKDSGDIVTLTEVKSTGNIDFVSGPKRMHLFQVHAYMDALGLEDAQIIYVDKDDLLDPKVYHIEFDADVWERLTTWAKETTAYAASRKLPPADPPEGWMCDYCEFQNRCGKGRTNLAEDMGPIGFVPGYTGYPKHVVKNHLDAYDNVTLTPSLALTYPDLADEYTVSDWACPNCTATFEYDDPDQFNDFENGPYNTPHCPACASVFDISIHLSTPNHPKE